MNSVSRPVRLIPQTAQPIEFSCPLCGTVHAAYYFSSARFKIYRCGGCGLTFANQLAATAADDETPAANKPKRSEEQHKTLISLLSDDIKGGSLLLFADRTDSIVSLLEQMNINVRLVCGRDDLRSIPSTTRFSAVIVSDAIMRVDDPCRALKNIRSF